jgi:hypothetical protein
MTGPGIHTISPDAYHADPAETPSLSASVAKILLTSSPAHARAAHPRLNPDLVRETDAKFDLGNVCHSLMLQGIEAAKVLGYPDWRTAAAKKDREQARQHGLIPMLAHHWEAVEAMVKATHTWIAALEVDPLPFTAGQPEQTLVWEDNGVMCRARLDWLHDDYTIVDDYKTTSASASPKPWSDRTMYGIGGDLQAAFYIRGVRAHTGVTPKFRFVVQETAAPFALSVIEIGSDVLAIGDAKVDRALAIWKRCLETDEWPSYQPTAYRAELPPWEESRWLEREAREEIAA